MSLSHNKSSTFLHLELMQCPRCMSESELQWQEESSSLLCPGCQSRYAVSRHSDPQGNEVLIPDLLEAIEEVEK